MATFEQIKTLADETYKRIWDDWYQSISGVTPAYHDFQLSDMSAGYSHSRNWLFNPMFEGNLDDPDILDADGWPIWKIELVHEMFHEYQCKAIRKPSADGVELFKRYRRSFCGQGHDETFFSAIAEKASYFRLTPEQLIQQI